MRHGAAAALAVLLLTPAAAEEAPQPPLWAHLAECSAVFGAAATADGYTGGDPRTRADIAAASGRFRERAVAVAGEAGQQDPEADVASIMDYLVPRWENRVGNILSLESNLDWIAYCRRLGQEQGVITQ